MEHSPHLKIEFEPTTADFAEAAWFQRRREASDDPFKSLRIVGFTATALGALFLFMRPDGGGWVGPALLISTGLFIPLRLSAITAMQRAKFWEENARFLQPATWEFSDDIRVTTPFYSVTYHWTAFMNWAESEKLFFLYQTEKSFRIVPKRAFHSEQQIAEFRQMLAARILPPTSAFPVISNSGSGAPPVKNP